MTEHCCCRQRSRSLPEAGVRFAGWIVPGAILFVLPKCPLCFIAAISLATGVGISMNMGTLLRFAIIVTCILLMAMLAMKELRQLLIRKTAPVTIPHPDIQSLMEIKR